MTFQRSFVWEENENRWNRGSTIRKDHIPSKVEQPHPRKMGDPFTPLNHHGQLTSPVVDKIWMSVSLDGQVFT